MSRLSNLTTVKIGMLNSWNSYWYDNYYYSFILFSDLKVKDYLSSLFYSLRIISDYLNVYRFSNLFLLLKTNLIFLNRTQFNFITVSDLTEFNREYELFFNKKYWNKFLLNLKFVSLIDKKLSYSILKRSLFKNLSSINLFIEFFSRIKFLFNSFILVLDNDIKLLDININLSYHKNNKANLFNNSTEEFFSYFFNYFEYYIKIYPNSLYLYRMNEFKTLIYFSYSIKFYISIIILNIFHILKYLIFLNLLLTWITINLLSLCDILVTILKQNTIPYYQIDIYNSNSINDPLLVYNAKSNLTRTMFYFLRNKIESSIYKYENKSVFFYFHIYMNKIPFFTSAKIITDLIAFFLESGNTIVRSFFFIYNLQQKFFKKKRRLEYTYYINKNKYKEEKYSVKFLRYVFHYALKKFPLIGIRVECSGTFKKGKMSRSYYYTSWIKDYLMTGSMPHNTMISDIDYYQYYAILPSSSVGIKTWIFLETYLYNANNIYVGIIY